MFKFIRSRVVAEEEEAQQLLENTQPLLVHKLDGTPVDVDLTRACSVAEVRERVAVALGVDTQPPVDYMRPHVGLKFLNGGCDVCDGTPLDSLDRDLGLSVILVQGAPDWYPRDKYVFEDQEVLQITMTGDEYFAEFVNGSSQQVDRAFYQKVLQEWHWQEVSRENRFWAHPPEKPKDSVGWTDFMAGVMTSRNAVRGVGAAAGFLAGVTGHLEYGPDGNGDFGTSFQVAQFAGLVVYGGICIARAVRK
mmetsp:Transcript_118970/g.210403  ORF Transcript_118970/g.210403 Transcript_118970/m.210403 type:complete len:249 (-) Transcript_118970:379-1125(-)